MQAIQTKYLGPTNYRGSCIKASSQAASLAVAYDHALDLAGNHRAAAKTLANHLGWLTEDDEGQELMHSGCLSDGSYAHVFTGR